MFLDKIGVSYILFVSKPCSNHESTEVLRNARSLQFITWQMLHGLSYVHQNRCAICLKIAQHCFRGVVTSTCCVFFKPVHYICLVMVSHFKIALSIPALAAIIALTPKVVDNVFWHLVINDNPNVSPKPGMHELGAEARLQARSLRCVHGALALFILLVFVVASINQPFHIKITFFEVVIKYSSDRFSL